ncbi:hypothetical protein QOT17_014613 [Balamuthia mandrillaris]
MKTSVTSSVRLTFLLLSLFLLAATTTAASASPRQGLHAGEIAVDTTQRDEGMLDPLAGHGGKDRNLIMRYNFIPFDATSIDVIVYLHGFSSLKDWEMTRSAANISGIELKERARPTIALIPRGKNMQSRRYAFPALATTPEGCQRLVDYGLALIEELLDGERAKQGLEPSSTPLTVSRLIWEASSAGGNAIIDMLTYKNNNPHQVHLYDATYKETTSVIDWVKRRITHDRNELRRLKLRHVDNQLAYEEAKMAYMSNEGGGFRNFYIPGTGTEPASKAIADFLPLPGDELRLWYRDQETFVGHAEIPKHFGVALQKDPTHFFADGFDRLAATTKYLDIEQYTNGLTETWNSFANTLNDWEKNQASVMRGLTILSFVLFAFFFYLFKMPKRRNMHHE